jgi:hypothetical protein
MSAEQLIWLVAVSATFIVPVVIVPILVYYRHERRRIELEHEKSMRAIELGRPLPGDRPAGAWFSAAHIGLVIGAGVPVGVFLCTAIATIVAGFHEAMWIATGMVGLGGVISGAVLAGNDRMNRHATPDQTTAKPYLEEDAYDVVSARG